MLSFRWVPLLGALVLFGCGERPVPESEVLVESREPAATGPRAWFPTQELTLRVGTAFGSFVAMSEDTAVVGDAEGTVFAYTLADGQWVDPQELDVDGAHGTLEYGLSAAISGNTAIVGTPDVGPGGAYVFSRIGSTWTPTDHLLGNETSIYSAFGAAVAIDGDLIVVGAPMDEAAHVFARVGARWIQQKQLVAGDNPLSPGYRNRFGAAVAISGRTVVVGAPEAGDPDSPYNAGKAYVFTRPSDITNTWPEVVLVPTARHPSMFFGKAVAAAGETVVVGAPSLWQNYWGSVHVFTGSRFVEQELASQGTRCCDEFGTSIAMASGRLFVGARYFMTGPRVVPGAAFVFARSGTDWVREQAIVPTVSDEFFGTAVGISSGSLIVGAPLANPRGAAYARTLLGDTSATCEASSECGLGHCVTGVCCESKCDGACEECSSGACLPVASGSPGTPACGTYVCDGVTRTCPSSCVANGDCVETYYCLDGACTPKASEGERCVGPEGCLSRNCVQKRCSGMLPNGARCDEASSCARGYCVDGVCCNDRCGEQCEACDVPDHEGECTAVAGSPHGARAACAGAGTPCEGSCDGETVATCDYPTGSTTCGSVCRGDTETVSACDGQGECVAGRARPCDQYTCDDDALACRTSCASNDDCAGDFACWNDGTCASASRCVNDYESESAPGGELDDCRPYVCFDGPCKTSCAVPTDCAASNTCDQNHHCVPLSGDAAGCGCRTAQKSSSGSAFGAFLVLLALLRRRTLGRASATRRRA